jgi:chromosome segregation ATPase
MKKQPSVLEDECEFQMTLDDALSAQRVVEPAATVPVKGSHHQKIIQHLEKASGDDVQMSAQLDEVTSKYHELMAKVNLLQAQELEAREKLQLLSATLSETLVTTQKLASRRLMEESRLAELEVRSDQLNQQMESNLALSQKRLDQLEQQCANREAELAETMTAIAAKRLELGALEQEQQSQPALKLVEVQQTELQTELETSAQRLKETHEEQNSAQIQLAATLAQLDLAEYRLVEVLQQLQDSQTAGLEAADHEAVLNAEMRMAKWELESLQSELQTCRSAQQEEDRHLQVSHADLEFLNADIAQKKAEQAEHENALQDLSQLIQEREQTLVQIRHEEKAMQQKLLELNQEQQRLQGSVAALLTGEKAERARYEELRDLTQAATHEYGAQKDALASRLQCAHQELADTEAKMKAMHSLATRLAQAAEDCAKLPPSSDESEEARNTMDCLLSEFHQVLDQRPGTALPVAAPSMACTAAVSPLAPSSRDSSDSGLLTSRLNRLRETLQREEARLQYLQRERARQESRSRANTPLQADPALREQDRKLEEKIRLNEARLELQEARLRRGQEDEKRQKEKLATLAQQLVEMRMEFCAKPMLAHH